MPTFEETWDMVVRDNKLARWAGDRSCAFFWFDTGRSAATFAANSKLGDQSNEGMKRARLEAAISKLSARYPTKDEAEYLREVIAEAQG